MCVWSLVVQAQPTGQGLWRSWQFLVLVPLLRRKSRTAIIVDWAPQMRESDRPTDNSCTAPGTRAQDQSERDRQFLIHVILEGNTSQPLHRPSRPDRWKLPSTIPSSEAPELPQCKLPLTPRLCHRVDTLCRQRLNFFCVRGLLF